MCVSSLGNFVNVERTDTIEKEEEEENEEVDEENSRITCASVVIKRKKQLLSYRKRILANFRTAVCDYPVACLCLKQSAQSRESENDDGASARDEETARIIQLHEFTWRYR